MVNLYCRQCNVNFVKWKKYNKIQRELGQSREGGRITPKELCPPARWITLKNNNNIYA